MTRYEAIEKALRGLFAVTSACLPDAMLKDYETALVDARYSARAALALPEDSKTVNAELYGLAIMMLDKYVELGMRIDNAAAEHSGDASIFQSAGYTNGVRYLSLREASGEPMPYKVIREGDKVRFL